MKRLRVISKDLGCEACAAKTKVVPMVNILGSTKGCKPTALTKRTEVLLVLLISTSSFCKVPGSRTSPANSMLVSESTRKALLTLALSPRKPGQYLASPYVPK